jgi:hypothetical protein
MNRRDFLVGSVGSVLPWKTFLNQQLIEEQPLSVFSHPREWIYGRKDPSVVDREAKAADYSYPEKVPGVEFYRLRSPVSMASRYPTWEYDERKSTVYSIRRVEGRPADKEMIRAQNEELDNYRVQVDILQFNPNPREDIQDWNLFRDNYLSVPFSSCMNITSALDISRKEKT